MKTRIKATKIELTTELKEYVWEKINILEKYLGNTQVLNCDVELAVSVGGQNSGKIYRAEINLMLPGKMLRVEKTEKDIKKAIDKVKDHLEISIKKYKGKRLDKERR